MLAAMQARVFISGTSRGIGAQVARELLGRGWDVVGIARGPAAHGLEGSSYQHHSLDLSDPNGLHLWCETHMTEEALAGFDRVALINNAAMLEPVEPMDRLDPVAYAQHLCVNVVAPAALTAALLRVSPRAVPLRIINLSSGAATSPYAGWSAYCSGKAALAMADQVLAKELASYEHLKERDVAVVTYAPHVVATRMQETLRSLSDAQFPERQKFVDLNAKDLLVGVEGPAQAMADLLVEEDLPPYSQLRYTPPG